MLQLQKCARQYYHPVLKCFNYQDLFCDELNWYKRDGELLKHVHLCVFNRQSPVYFMVFYGVHPFYLDAPLPPKRITAKDFTYSSEVMRLYQFRGSRIVSPYLDYLEVPDDLDFGAAQLAADLLPLLDQIEGTSDAFQLHKKAIKRDISASPFPYTIEQTARFYSLDYIDEALFERDEQSFPLCFLRANELLAIENRRLRPSKRVIERINRQISVIQTHEFSAFKSAMEEKAANNIVHLGQSFNQFNQGTVL